MHEWVRVGRAWAAMHVMDAMLAIRGFDAAFGFAHRWRHPPGDGRLETSADDTIAVWARAIGAARRWHLRLTVDDCLPVALSGVYLLRRRGVDAHLVLGVTKSPFYAHAWVTANGTVIDFPREKYKQFAAIDLSSGLGESRRMVARRAVFGVSTTADERPRM